MAPMKEWLISTPVQQVQWAKVTYRWKVERRWTTKTVDQYNTGVDVFNKIMTRLKHRGFPGSTGGLMLNPLLPNPPKTA